MKFVMQNWLSKLSFKQQTVLLLALRGCDGKVKNDYSKALNRHLRSLVLHNADKKSTFIYENENILSEYFPKFLHDIDSYPLHFFFHMLHAMEIIGYKHPDEKISTLYSVMYADLCKACHLNVETEKQLDERLK